MIATLRHSFAAIGRPAIAFLRIFRNFAGAAGWRATALVAAGALLDGAGLLLLIPILDTVVTRAEGRAPSRIGAALDSLGLHAALPKLCALLAAFVLLAVVRAVTQKARDVALADLQGGFVEHQRNAVIRTLARASWARIVGLRHAQITTLITSEVARVASGAQYMIQGAVAVAMLLVQGVLALLLAPVLALATIALVVVGGGVVLLAQGKVRDIGKDLVVGNARLMGSATGFLSGLKAATAQNAQAEFVAEFEATQAAVRDHQFAFVKRQASGREVFAIGSSVAAAVVVLIGVMTAVPPATLITLVLVFARMSGPAIQLQQSAQNFFFMLPSFEAMQRFQSDMQATETAAPAPVLPPPGPIEVSGVAYLHPGGGGVRATTLTIAQGCFVGVAGPSGAGKTTLIDVLTGLTEPQQGHIAVGGLVLDTASRAGWRDTVAYVPQEGFLFHDSIRRNLAWGNDAPDEAAIWHALALVGADALVRAMPAKLETVVGERGALLSGGERQRLTLARAVLRRSRLLVLDEAMNAIDAESEALLLARIAALDPRPTVLMISHRAESMAVCDRVIRVERGVATMVPA